VSPAGSEADGAPARPLLTVVRGEPTPEQLAALIAVVAARASAAAPDEPPPQRSLWSRPVLRAPLHPGLGAWRASALPH
jgi:hypothetical protein